MKTILKEIRDKVDALWEYIYNFKLEKDKYVLDSLENILTDLNILILKQGGVDGILSTDK